MEQIKIGDTVEVIYTGEVYSTYKEAFKSLGFKNKEYNDTETGQIGKVFGIKKHNSNGDTMYAVRFTDGREVSIGTRGLKLLNSRNMLYKIY